MASERIHRDYRLEKDRDYFNIEDVLQPAGTPQPERTCASCDHYIRGRLEMNCSAGGGSMGSTGPLRAACPKYEPKNTDTTMEKTTPTTKVCKRCGRELPLEAFGKTVRSKDGYQSNCRECQAELVRQGWEKRRAEGKAHPAPMRKKAINVKLPDKVAKAVKEADHAIEDRVVEECIAHDALKYFNDNDLAQELRRRGYDVTCKKIIEL